MAAPSRTIPRALAAAFPRIRQSVRAKSRAASNDRLIAVAAAFAAAGTLLTTEARADVTPAAASAPAAPAFHAVNLKSSSTDQLALQPLPESPEVHSPHSALLNAVSHLDSTAVQSLAILSNDLDNHIPLLEAGAAHSLCQALRACEAQPEDQVSALRVNLLRVLADLSKSEAAHSYFKDSQIVGILASTLAKYPLRSNVTWYDWILVWLGFASVKGEEKIAKRNGSEVEEQREGIGDAMIDYLTTDLPSPGMLEVDLEAGTAYHAARCVSNLARNTSMHQHLLSSGVLQPLLVSLHNADVGAQSDQQRVELIRCTILAVAALAKSAPTDVVSAGGHKQLIQFMSQYDDPIAQMYAAGGVRNLARHASGDVNQWKAHRELVVGGVASALERGMDKKAGAQTQVFATLAFGDLMTTGHHKAEIIRRRLGSTFAAFAKLLEEKNVSVSRAVYRTLLALYGEQDGEVSGDAQGRNVVPTALGKELAGMSGQLVNGAVARGDVQALKAARAMCKDDTVASAMVDKGFLEVLVRGASKGKGEYWEECIAALSILSGWAELTPLMISRGALKAVLQRPCFEKSGRWSAAFFANVARNEGNHAEVAHGGLKVLLFALSSKDPEARREGARGMYNLSLGGVSRVMIGQGGALAPLVTTAASTKGDARRYAIGALAKISEAYEHATKLIEADITSALLTAAREDVRVAKDVAMCLSHLSQVIEVHGSLARSGAAAWLVEMASKNGGRGDDAAEVMHYATLGICNIAYSAGITRAVLRECGAVPILTALSSSGMSAPHVVYSARQALHNLKGNEKPAMLPIEASAKPSMPA